MKWNRLRLSPSANAYLWRGPDGAAYEIIPIDHFPGGTVRVWEASREGLVVGHFRYGKMARLFCQTIAHQAWSLQHPELFRGFRPFQRGKKAPQGEALAAQ